MAENMVQQELFSPRIPFRGVNSATSAAYLPPGKLSSVTNLRSVRGQATIRLPLTTTGKATVNGTFRGCYESLFDGVPTIFVAAVVSGSVRVYKSLDAGFSFSEITAASGAYGNTRMTDTGSLFWFQTVKDRPYLAGAAYDCLVIQNGTDSPRLYGKGSTYAGTSAGSYICVTLVQPDIPQHVTQGGRLKNFVAVNDPAATTYTTSPTGWTFSDHSATLGKNWVNISIGNTYTNGQALITIPALNVSSQSFVMVVSTPATATNENIILWDQMKIELGDGTNFCTFNDPESQTADFVVLDTGTAGTLGTLFALQYTQIGGPIVSPGSVNMAAITQIRLTFVGTAPSGTYTGSIYIMGAQGYDQAGTGFAVAFTQANGRGIGTGVQATDAGLEVSTLMGGSTDAIFKLSDDPRFSYDYFLRSDNSTLYTSGVDRMLVYRRSPGEADFYLMGSTLMATYAGTWTLVNALGCFFEDINLVYEDYSRPALDPAYVICPIGLSMTATSSRLAVAAGNRFWYSGDERPFQFRQYVLDDGNGGLLPASPGSLGIDGEMIQRLISIGSLSGGNETLGSPSNGVATIFIVTDRTTSWVTGWDATSLNKRNLMYAKGTYSPASVAPSRGGFLFVDTDRQVVSVEGFTPVQISRDIVDDKLLAIGDARIAWAWGVVRNDRYYLCYSVPGDTKNTFALIYDAHESERYGERVWLRDEFPTAVSGVSALLAYRSGAKTLLIGFDSLGQCLEHETEGAVNDAGISGVLWHATFPEVNDGMWKSVRVRRMGLVTTSQMGEIQTARTKIGRQVESSSQGIVNTDTGVIGSRCVRWDRLPDSDGNAGIDGSSILVSLVGQSPSNSQIYVCLIEQGPTNIDGPDVTPFP